MMAFYPVVAVEKFCCYTERFIGALKQNTIYELEVFQDGFENDPFWFPRNSAFNSDLLECWNFDRSQLEHHSLSFQKPHLTRLNKQIETSEMSHINIWMLSTVSIIKENYWYIFLKKHFQFKSAIQENIISFSLE